jgi:hypothetical protein
VAETSAHCIWTSWCSCSVNVHKWLNSQLKNSEKH